MSGKLVIFNHPLMTHKLAIIRNEVTNTKDFRETVSEIANLMAYEATRNLPVKEVEIKTPIAVSKTTMIDGDIVIVPILRAGLGMVEGIQRLIPQAKVGYVGLARNEETLEPELYYAKFPTNISEATVFVVDPMLATGGSCAKAIEILKEKGAKNIIYMGIVGVDEGINKVRGEHPDVDIFLAAKDEKLNEKGYIVPGLGDCGDRLFGTK
ncbi:MAG: uracil phosphoribosyltransferase [Erysipelotrichaceae bacterium]|nr:uracil phosphoribosyltransferase [Erysipelotrichaceae bacterium]